MNIKIHIRSVDVCAPIITHAEEKIRLMLGIFSSKIRRVDIYLSDLNGPRGGVDMCSKIKISIDAQLPLVAEARAETLRTAVDICTHRAKQSLSRRLARSADRRRDSSFDAQVV